MSKRKPVDAAISAAGSAAQLARMLGITDQAILKWRNKGEIPLSRVFDVERVTGIHRSVLRPDFFAEAPRQKPSNRR